MKATTNINTGIITPNPSRYSYTDQDRKDNDNFKKEIGLLLGIPEDSNKYFEWDSSSDYISLKEKGSYKQRLFRRFKRGKEAVISEELMEDIKEHIEIIDQKNSDAKTREEAYQYFKKMIQDILEPLNSDTLNVYYYYSGVSIELRHLKRSELTYLDKITNVTIGHDSNISEPQFLIHTRYTEKISVIKAWLQENEEYYTQIMQKAQEVKEMLPEAYFTTVYTG